MEIAAGRIVDDRRAAGSVPLAARIPAWQRLDAAAWPFASRSNIRRYLSSMTGHA